MSKAKAGDVKSRGKPPAEVEPQAEGHGRTRFDANIVTLSGRVVSKDAEYVTSFFHHTAQTEQSATLFVLNVVRNHEGATTVVDVPCRVFGTGHYKAMDEGDMIAVLGELHNTRVGKGLYVEVKHWHLLEPRGWRGKTEEVEQ